jgi:hypothetical protein
MPHPFCYPTCIALACAALLTGCGGSDVARAPIEGRVTIAGQPLASGRILFVPLSPNAGPAASARVVDGEYCLSTGEGPAVGQNRVEVEADADIGFAIDDEAAFAQRRGRPLPPDPIPPEFNTRSQLVVEVQAGRQNTFDVTVPQARHTVARASY